MPNVDITRKVSEHAEVKASQLVEYARSTVTNGYTWTCVIRLDNGFEAVGSVENTYFVGASDEFLKGIAHQRALDYVARHGYSLT